MNIEKTVVNIGDLFGRLTVVTKIPFRPKKKTSFLCQCACGNTKIVLRDSLVSGKTKSCRCLAKELLSIRSTKAGYKRTGDRLYTIYAAIKQRCYYKKSIGYRNYGQRGILVCEEWLGVNGFENFKKWAESSGYSLGLSIDRTDNDKNYSPENCKWSTMKEQENNRRNNHIVEYREEKMTVSALADRLSISGATILNRLSCGWSEDELSMPTSYSNKAIRRRRL